MAGVAIFAAGLIMITGVLIRIGGRLGVLRMLLHR